MSKAFVKETDDEAELADEPPAIPAGVKNYMTRKATTACTTNCASYCGWSARKCWKPWPGPLGTATGRRTATNIYGKRRLREIDRRIRFCQAAGRAEVVDPNQQRNRIRFFGATVTYANGCGSK
jgi:transcription elongation factor GreB